MNADGLGDLDQLVLFELFIELFDFGFDGTVGHVRTGDAIVQRACALNRVSQRIRIGDFGVRLGDGFGTSAGGDDARPGVFVRPAQEVGELSDGQ